MGTNLQQFQEYQVYTEAQTVVDKLDVRKIEALFNEVSTISLDAMINTLDVYFDGNRKPTYAFVLSREFRRAMKPIGIEMNFGFRLKTNGKSTKTQPIGFIKIRI